MATKEEILNTFVGSEGAWWAYKEGIQTGYDEAFNSLRNQAAIAAMQGILCAPIVEGINPNPSKEHIAELAVAQANALIEKLKEK